MVLKIPIKQVTPVLGAATTDQNDNVVVLPTVQDLVAPRSRVPSRPYTMCYGTKEITPFLFIGR